MSQQFKDRIQYVFTVYEVATVAASRVSFERWAKVLRGGDGGRMGGAGDGVLSRATATRVCTALKGEGFAGIDSAGSLLRLSAEVNILIVGMGCSQALSEAGSTVKLGEASAGSALTAEVSETECVSGAKVEVEATTARGRTRVEVDEEVGDGLSRKRPVCKAIKSRSRLRSMASSSAFCLILNEGVGDMTLEDCLGV